MFGPKNHCVVVVGAQWGDEGKGKIVDVLSERADLVVRYQGGANAGHTVVKGDDEFILHQIPSGILHERTSCLIGNGVVLDPETLISEIDELASRGVRTDGRLFLSDRAHLVLPYHKLIDRAYEEVQKIGTTGCGIGPAYEDKYGRRGIRLGDLSDLECAQAAVTDAVDRANRVLAMLDSSERATVEQHVALFERVAPRLLPMTTDIGRLTYDALRDGRRVLLEGAQGALLDVDHGTYPFVTSSNTTAGGASVGAGIGPTAIDAILGVVKAYTTRVGNGPLPTEGGGREGEQLRTLGDEYGATTGRPRRCGWFDAVVARYAVRINGFDRSCSPRSSMSSTRFRASRCAPPTEPTMGWCKTFPQPPTRWWGSNRSTRFSKGGASRRTAPENWPTYRPRPAPTSTASRICFGCPLGM